MQKRKVTKLFILFLCYVLQTPNFCRNLITGFSLSYFPKVGFKIAHLCNKLSSNMQLSLLGTEKGIPSTVSGYDDHVHVLLSKDSPQCN